LGPGVELRFVLTFLLTASAALAGQIRVAPHSNALVLTHVSVVDTRHGLTLPDMTVVIKDGTIQAVAKFGLIDSGHITRVVNGTGKYVIPGLWDMHVHSAGGPAPAWDENVLFPLYLANGITGIRDMGGDPTVAEERRKQVESGAVFGPHMVIAGPFLNRGKSDAQTIGVNSPEEARRAVDSLKLRGMDFIKVLDMDPGPYWALLDEAKAQHLRVVGHVPNAVSAAEAAQVGQSSIEHLSGVLLASSDKEVELRQELLDAITKKDGAAYSRVVGESLNTYNASKAWQLFGIFVESCTWQVPTLTWNVTESSIDNPRIVEDPRTKYVPASVLKTWEPSKLLQTSGTEQLNLDKKIAAQHMKLVDLMRRAGVLIMAGTDSPDPYVVPGFSLHDELELLVKAGLSTTQALQAATLYPAIFLTKLNRYGVVEEGHAADLVILDDDPLKDISNARKISAVVVGGKYFGRDDLDKMLQRAAEIARSE
jgi:imidazolonepropionase-like amidohydrolase